MAKKRTKTSNPATQLHHSLGWVLLAGLWLLLLTALASYDPADWPSHFAAPYNPTPHNWVGYVGAFIAYKIYLMVGPGIWIGMAGLSAFLVATAIGKRITQPVLRLIGLAIMCLATSAIVGLAAGHIYEPTMGQPQGPSGLVASFMNRELSLRFGVVGTFIIVAAGFWIGAILAVDQWVMAMPNAAAHLFRAVSLIRIPRPVLVGGLSGVSGGVSKLARWISARTTDQTPIRHSGVLTGRRRAADLDEPIDEDTGGLGATQSFGLNEPATCYDEQDQLTDDDDDPSDTDGEVDAPGAYTDATTSFDPDALREKIKQLPINFAPKIPPKTDAPLGSVQEVDLSDYQFPGMDLLTEPESNFTAEMERIVRDQAVQLESALQQYRIEGEVVGIDSGPVITLFEVRLAPGTKVSQVNAISSDLARALKAHNIRIVPNMVGKDTVGIEVPNLKKERVRLKELMTAQPQAATEMNLPMYLGKDASGNPLIADLATLPHMLIAGTTGSGKSVCMNSIIMSFLYTKRPNELKLVLVDPKMVEMSMFRDIPHLMCPVVTEMSKATAILEWATTKMDERYELLAEAGVRDIGSYNKLDWEELVLRFNPATQAEEARIPKKLPYLVFVIDELADLIITNKEVEGFIVRLAQKARAVGIHLILATQRPQANVVTGLIKSNMPGRISFKVASSMDSRIVLDQKGAELLLGQGDMLFLSPRTSKLTRAQGTLVEDLEVRKVIRFLKTIAQQNFEPQLVQIKNPGLGDGDEDRDPLFDDAVRLVIQTKRGSVSLLQRRLTIGYSRASRLIEQIAAAGIIGEYKGSQAREVNLTIEEWDALCAQAQADAQAETNELDTDTDTTVVDQATDDDDEPDDDFDDTDDVVDQTQEDDQDELAYDEDEEDIEEENEYEEDEDEGQQVL